MSLSYLVDLGFGLGNLSGEALSGGAGLRIGGGDAAGEGRFAVGDLFGRGEVTHVIAGISAGKAKHGAEQQGPDETEIDHALTVSSTDKCLRIF